MTIRLKYFHNSVNNVVIFSPWSLLNVPNFLEHLWNEIKWRTFLLQNWWHIFFEINLMKKKNSTLIQIVHFFVSKEKCCQIWTCPALFGFWFVLTFVMELKDGNYESHWYILVMPSVKNDIRFKYAPWKNVWLCFVCIVWAIKLRNFDFISHWNTLIFFDKRIDFRFEYVQWKTVWFCFLSIVWAHFSFKTYKFWFWKS